MSRLGKIAGVHFLLVLLCACAVNDDVPKWAVGSHYKGGDFFDDEGRFSTMSEMRTVSFTSAGMPTNVEGIVVYADEKVEGRRLIRAWPRYLPHGPFWEIGRVKQEECFGNADWWRECDAVYGTSLPDHFQMIDTQTGREITVSVNTAK